MSPARCPASGPTPSPDSFPFLPSDIAELPIRIEATDAHLMRLKHLYEIGSSVAASTPGNWSGRDADPRVGDCQPRGRHRGAES